LTLEKMKPVLPYIGLPILLAALMILHINSVELFRLLQDGLLIIFGYIAAVGDIKTKRIPNGLVLAMLAGWVLTAVPQLFFNIELMAVILWDSLLGFLVSGILFLIVYLISRKGLGGGDIKFMAIAGLYLGFGRVLPVMLYGSVLAGVVVGVLFLLKKIGKKDAVAFAPFLFIGMLITTFFQ